MMPFRSLSVRSKLLVVAATATALLVAIAYVAFVEVTLRRTFALASPWETVGAFLVVTAGLAVLARAMGLHETR